MGEPGITRAHWAVDHEPCGLCKALPPSSGCQTLQPLAVGVSNFSVSWLTSALCQKCKFHPHDRPWFVFWFSWSGQGLGICIFNQLWDHSHADGLAQVFSEWSQPLEQRRMVTGNGSHWSTSSTWNIWRIQNVERRVNQHLSNQSEARAEQQAWETCLGTSGWNVTASAAFRVFSPKSCLS